MNLEFNEIGYLDSEKILIVDLDTINYNFVFNDISSKLFLEFKQFIKNLGKLRINKFYCWIDGSFISLKTQPNDIDVIIFFETNVYQKFEYIFDDLKSQFENIDVYFVQIYPENHPKHIIGKSDELDWLHFLTKDRRKNKKGIVQLNIEL